jgi:hypothetical protein
MQEVQFVSDLTINLLQGLSDYSTSLLLRYYKDFDENFPQEEGMTDRLESLFERLAALDPGDFSDTIFRSAQVAFSLMIVLISVDRRVAPPDRVHAVIRQIDSEVMAEHGPDRVVELRYVEGFTGGNLHRIFKRSIRDEIIREAFV